MFRLISTYENMRILKVHLRGMMYDTYNEDNLHNTFCGKLQYRFFSKIEVKFPSIQPQRSSFLVDYMRPTTPPDVSFKHFYFDHDKTVECITAVKITVHRRGLLAEELQSL